MANPYNTNAVKSFSIHGGVAATDPKLLKNSSIDPRSHQPCLLPNFPGARQRHAQLGRQVEIKTRQLSSFPVSQTTRLGIGIRNKIITRS
jgi:hypothetical protein